MKIVFVTVLINFVALSISQECNPSVVEWQPHQYSCQKYILCFHGNPLGASQNKLVCNELFNLSFHICFRTIVCTRSSLQSNRFKMHISVRRQMWHQLFLPPYRWWKKSSFPSRSIRLPKVKQMCFSSRTFFNSIFDEFQILRLLQRRCASENMCWWFVVGRYQQLVHEARWRHLWWKNFK